MLILGGVVLALAPASALPPLLRHATALGLPPARTLAPSVGDSPTIDARDIERAIARGTAILLAEQESLDANTKPNEWPYEGVYRVLGKKGPEIPIGYRIGGTAICATALLECSTERTSRPVDEAVARALDFVLTGLDDPQMSAGFTGSYDVRGWGHAYTLGFLLRMRQLERVPEKKSEAVDAAIRELVATLQKSEIASRGGWNYARGKAVENAVASTFMTAPTLQFLFEAAAQGEAVDREVVARALDALESARLETGAFQYAVKPSAKTGKGFEDVPGAIGRMPVCEVTLWLAGRGSVARIESSLAAFFEHWEWLEKRRKQNGTHVEPYMIAPYYFFYAHRYAAQAIEFLPEAERAGWRQKLHRLLWKVREQDGGWNDRVFPRSVNFGTAMALFALREPELPRPAAWDPK